MSPSVTDRVPRVTAVPCVALSPRMAIPRSSPSGYTLRAPILHVLITWALCSSRTPTAPCSTVPGPTGRSAIIATTSIVPLFSTAARPGLGDAPDVNFGTRTQARPVVLRPRAVMQTDDYVCHRHVCFGPSMRFTRVRNLSPSGSQIDGRRGGVDFGRDPGQGAAGQGCVLPRADVKNPTVGHVRSDGRGGNAADGQRVHRSEGRDVIRFSGALLLRNVLAASVSLRLISPVQAHRPGPSQLVRLDDRPGGEPQTFQPGGG